MPLPLFRTCARFLTALGLAASVLAVRQDRARATEPRAPDLEILPMSTDDGDAAAPDPTRSPVLGQGSLVGPVGLFGVSTAEVGNVGELRLGLNGELFSASSFLIEGDSDLRLRSGLTLGYTPDRRFEIFGALLNTGNRNERKRDAADRDPVLLKSFGDVVLGAKGVWPIGAPATLGVELGVKFLAGVSDLSVSGSSTSVWLGPSLMYDLRALARPLPARVHASASYYFDNSSNLRDLSSVTRDTKEVAMFGYGMAKSRLRLALAADAPLPPGRVPLAIDPFLEYHVEIVTADADATFSDYTHPACGSSAGRPCVDNRDMHWVTLGARAAVYRSLVASVGVDIRLRSVGFPYGTPLPPYNIVFGISLPIDVASMLHPKPATKVIETPAPPREGVISGIVRDGRGGAPIGGAVVAVAGRPRARAATDLDGGFSTINLPSGAVELEVTAAGFEPIKVVTTVVAGRAEEVAVAMTAQVQTATLRGRVTSRDGRALQGTIKLSGRGNTDGTFETRSDPTGAYAVTVPAGTYRVRVDAPGLPARDAQVELAANESRGLDFALRPAPASPDVQLAGEWIKLRRTLRFEGNSARLTPPTQHTLDAVAELLEVHVEIRHVQIGAHWDNSLPQAEAAELTRQQAEAVKAYLVGRGIAADRLTTTGAGSTRPLVPNLGPANQLRNRRVELHLE